jgi:hypothetical protein
MADRKPGENSEGADCAAGRCEVKTQEGPTVTIRRSCFDCSYMTSERYRCQGDSGHDVYCCHPSFDGRRHVSSSSWNTPNWCPFVGKESSGARIERGEALARYIPVFDDVSDVGAWLQSA